MKKTGPPSTEVDCAGMKTAVADNKFVIGYFGAQADSLYTNFVKFA